jgi:hypothetical protein
MNTPTTRTTKTARLFVQRGARTQNRAEAIAHIQAYALKSKDCQPETLNACAEEMAGLIYSEDCILIPVPDHNGDTSANLRLAEAIETCLKFGKGKAKVFDILSRTAPTESQCERHKAHERPLTPSQLNIYVLPHKPFDLRPIYFVDNVITSGATIQACHDALGFGTGLCYAEALRRA